MDWQYRGNKQKTRNIVATLNRNDFASFDSNEEGGGGASLCLSQINSGKM